jgi:hypothetical protein
MSQEEPLFVRKVRELAAIASSNDCNLGIHVCDMNKDCEHFSDLKRAAYDFLRHWRIFELDGITIDDNDDL